jgi:hypothetical protein
MAYRGLLNGGAFSARRMKRPVPIQAVLVPPNTDRRARFQMEFLENVLHVFLHRARAASQDLSDLAVAFAGSDPFDDFELAFGQGRRLGNRARSGAYFGFSAVPGGHGKIAFN